MALDTVTDPQPVFYDAPRAGSVIHSILQGSQIVSSSSGQTFIADDLEYHKPLKDIDFNDQNGAIQASIYVSMKGRGSATLQLVNAAQNIVPGETLTFSWLGGGTNSTVSVIVTDVGMRHQITGVTKAVVQFAEKLHP